MLVAVAMENSQISTHFAHATRFDIYDFVDDTFQVVSHVELDRKDLIGFFDLLKEKGIGLVIAGDMGENTYEHLIGREIQAVYGVGGDPVMIIEDYLAGIISEGDNAQEGGCALIMVDDE